MKTFALLALLLLQVGEQIRLQTGIIRGEIRGTDGQPAVGVRVSAVPVQPDAAAPSTMMVLSQTDASGRYTLEGVPPGRYFITAGLIDFPTYYPGIGARETATAVSVTAGATTEGISFALVQSAGVRVSGRLKGFPAGAPAGLFRVSLIPGPGAASPRRMQESRLASDGTFEFQRITLGIYDLRISPMMGLGAGTKRVEVQNRDIEGIEFDAGIFLQGKLVVDDGSPLPRNLAFSLPSGDLPASVVLSAQSLDTASRAGSALTPIRASDGAFMTLLSGGEYRIVPMQMPIGYSIKSITQGNNDLLKSPLKVAADSSSGREDILVTLTTSPPEGAPPWRRIQGRVLALPAGSSGPFWVFIENAVIVPQGTPGSTRRSKEALIGSDGTFEIANVPPDSYSIRVAGPGMGPPETVGLEVGNADVTGLELIAPKPMPSNPSFASPPPLSPTTLLTQPATLPSTEPVGVRVSGSVVVAGANERALMAQSVVLFGTRTNGRTFMAPVTAEGIFELLNVPPGEYDLRTLPSILPGQSTRVLVELQEVKGLRVALPAQSILQGRIGMAEGRAADLGRVLLKLTSADGELQIPVGEDGKFLARVSHGEYKVSAVAASETYVADPGTIRVNASDFQEITIGLRGETR